MTGFQHLAVAGRQGPHVTLLAGVEMAGRYWATTSASSAKVRLLSARPHAAVLSIDPSSDGGSWRLLAGRAVVLDARRPLDGLGDPLAVGLAGLALARIAAGNLDQLVGYVDDRHDIPLLWQPVSRVVIVVRADHRLEVRNGDVVAATGQFSVPAAAPTATRRRRRSGVRNSHLSAKQREILQQTVSCAVGVSTPCGPVAIPGTWQPGGSVRVDRSVLARVHARVPGPGCVTIDDSSGARPSSKVGVMLRGRLDLLAGAQHGAQPDAERDPPHCAQHGAGHDDQTADLAISVDSVSGWDGFDARSAPVGSRSATT